MRTAAELEGRRRAPVKRLLALPFFWQQADLEGCCAWRIGARVQPGGSKVAAGGGVAVPPESQEETNRRG